jgi:D-arginine dehydrogenase
MSGTSDAIVIGAGIAGASLAAALASTHRVRLLEMEERAAYHTTGRSAALYEPNYGPPVIRALTLASKPWFDAPPEGFAASPILTHRPTYFVVTRDQTGLEKEFLAEVTGIETLPLADARSNVPILRIEALAAAYVDPVTADIDVDLLHQSFLRRMRKSGGELTTEAEAMAIERRDGAWHVTTRAGTFSAPVVVNAAGAWGDVVAARAGVRPVGLQPKRRSVALIPPPDGRDVRDWPAVADIGETVYFKPTGGALLVSPADATPVEPHDAFADDMALAEGLDRFQAIADVEVTHLQRSWGGLRTFAPDGNPVVGYDPETPGFFWLVGQGGYGIQTSPALSEFAAALIRGEPPPGRLGLSAESVNALSPKRFDT